MCKAKLSLLKWSHVDVTIVTCHCTKCNMFSEHVYLHDSGLEMNCSHSLLYTSSFSVSSRTADGFDLPCNNDIELHVYLGAGIIKDDVC